MNGCMRKYENVVIEGLKQSEDANWDTAFGELCRARTRLQHECARDPMGFEGLLGRVLYP